ncbi:MAG: hypothetical protein ACLTC4_16380 [Hungatella hathewayi]
MSRFILHKKGKEQEWLKYLALGMVCVVMAAVSGFLVHSIGTAGAKSREIVEIHTWRNWSIICWTGRVRSIT